MKRHIKFFIILLPALFLLVGCAPTYGVEFQLPDDSDFYLDLLIPLSTDDESYVESKNDTEIARYSADGYRSLTEHTDLIYTYRENGLMIFDYEFQEDFLRFCDKYGCFRIAQVSENGDIQRISEDIPLTSAKDCYLNRLTYYDPQENTLAKLYSPSGETENRILIGGAEIIMLLPTLITLIVLLISRRRNSGKFTGFIIAAAVESLPAIPLFIMHIMTCIKGTLCFEDFIKRLFFIYYPYIANAFVLAIPPLALLTASIILAKKHKEDKTS